MFLRFNFLQEKIQRFIIFVQMFNIKMVRTVILFKRITTRYKLSRLTLQSQH